MEHEFNLIDEPWICVRTNDCQIKEVSLKEVFLNAHEYMGLSGETKSQDFAIFRLILAVMYTIFSRYDTEGEKIDLTEESPDYPVDVWEKIWNSGQIPAEPIERYFEEWHDRFWLFDEKYPFYQSNAVNGKGKIYSTAKMIGTLFESANKARLFSARIEEGRVLSYAESARWLLHCNCFDDIAAKNPTPKRTWVGKLGMMMLRGNNLFETIMLNYCADVDITNDAFESKPSWEQDAPTTEFNRIIAVPENQAELLSLRSRQIYLYRENQTVTGYYISGGDYFEDDEVFQEQMTLWRGYQEKKNSQTKFKPKLYDTSRKAWQEFASIAVLAEVDKENDKAHQYRKAGVLEWLCKLIGWNILDEDYFVRIDTSAVIYDYGQATSLPVMDNVSDNLSFSAELLLESGYEWKERILEEIEKCDKIANCVYHLYKNLQKANGRQDKDNKTSLSGETDAKVQFYSSIDRPFRLWLAELKPEVHDMDLYTKELEKQLLKIALDFGRELASQSGDNAIFGHYDKQNQFSSAKALNEFESIVRSILKWAGEKDEQK
ncbi:MAG: type I-E CRISPR-associated protein Cse1/CasA [Oscillospiraceae bacterium]